MRPGSPAGLIRGTIDHGHSQESSSYRSTLSRLPKVIPCVRKRRQGWPMFQFVMKRVLNMRHKIFIFRFPIAPLHETSGQSHSRHTDRPCPPDSRMFHTSCSSHSDPEPLSHCDRTAEHARPNHPFPDSACHSPASSRSHNRISPGRPDHQGRFGYSNGQGRRLYPGGCSRKPERSRSWPSPLLHRLCCAIHSGTAGPHRSRDLCPDRSRKLHMDKCQPGSPQLLCPAGQQ